MYRPMNHRRPMCDRWNSSKTAASTTIGKRTETHWKAYLCGSRLLCTSEAITTSHCFAPAVIRSFTVIPPRTLLVKQYMYTMMASTLVCAVCSVQSAVCGHRRLQPTLLLGKGQRPIERPIFVAEDFFAIVKQLPAVIVSHQQSFVHLLSFPLEPSW